MDQLYVAFQKSKMVKEPKLTKIASASFDPNMGLAKLSRSFKYIKKNPDNKPVKVAILSNFSTQFLTMGLELALNDRGINGEMYEASYNHWKVELLDTGSGLFSFKPDIILLTFATEFLGLRDVKNDVIGFYYMGF